MTFSNENCIQKCKTETPYFQPNCLKIYCIDNCTGCLVKSIDLEISKILQKCTTVSFWNSPLIFWSNIKCLEFTRIFFIFRNYIVAENLCDINSLCIMLLGTILFKLGFHNILSKSNCCEFKLCIFSHIQFFLKKKLETIL